MKSKVYPDPGLAWILCSVLFRSGAGVWLEANRRIARKSLGWSRARGLGIRR